VIGSAAEGDQEDPAQNPGNGSWPKNTILPNSPQAATKMHIVTNSKMWPANSESHRLSKRAEVPSAGRGSRE
jgi:hypothetical protein